MASKVDGFYPDVEALSDVCVEGRESDQGGAQVKYLRVGEIQYVEAVVEQLYKEGKFDEPVLGCWPWWLARVET